MNYLFQGDLSFETAESALKGAKRLISDYPDSTLIFDLLGVNTCDTAGLAYLIELKRLCKLSGKALNFINIPVFVRDLIKLYGLEEILL